jgi:hypothetical protein
MCILEYVQKWAKRNFSKGAEGLTCEPGGSSITLALLGFWETKARRGNEKNLGVTNKVAVEEPR